VKQYAIAQFDAAKFEATKAAWLDSAESLGIPDLDYVKQIDWVALHMDYETQGDSFAYGLFDEESNVAVATVDIVYTKRSTNDGWLKMLQLFLAPKYAPSVVSASPQVLTEILEIYASSIIGTVELTGIHPARTVKLYARNDNLMSLLAGVQQRISANASTSTTCRFEGRFLVISAK
jgi:hypothetical protein